MAEATGYAGQVRRVRRKKRDSQDGRLLDAAGDYLAPEPGEKQSTPRHKLYYGDNLDVLRYRIQSESVDLCYIDPPFNSKRNYNQIYNNLGQEDRAQAQAFVDTWVWDDHAIRGYNDIITNLGNRFSKQTIQLIRGLRSVLGEGSLLAYLVSITLRVVEIQRVLKRSGSLYLHCDPTASHYLKLVLDSVFLPDGGDFRNEIIWDAQVLTARRSDLDQFTTRSFSTPRAQKRKITTSNRSCDRTCWAMWRAVIPRMRRDINSPAAEMS